MIKQKPKKAFLKRKFWKGHIAGEEYSQRLSLILTPKPPDLHIPTSLFCETPFVQG